MSAREIIARHAYGPLQERSTAADLILDDLTAAGYRLVAPGELDDETLERAVEAVETTAWDARKRNARSTLATAIRALKAYRRALEGDRL